MNRRKRKNRLAKRLARQLRELSLPDAKPAKASNYLHHLGKYHKKHPDIQAIIFCRVSARMQRYKRNLDTYEKLLRRRLKKRKIPVVGCYREVSSGWIFDPEKRYGLTNAIEKLKELNDDKTVIVAASTDRFLRNKNFHTKRHMDILPTVSDFEQLKKLTGDIPLLTLLHPDMPPRKVRGYQILWGQKAKGNKGGRPKGDKPVNKPGYKKNIWREKSPRVLQLHKKGVSIRKISKLIGVAKSTVYGWSKNSGN